MNRKPQSWYHFHQSKAFYCYIVISSPHSFLTHSRLTSQVIVVTILEWLFWAFISSYCAEISHRIWISFSHITSHSCCRVSSLSTYIVFFILLLNSKGFIKTRQSRLWIRWFFIQSHCSLSRLLFFSYFYFLYTKHTYNTIEWQRWRGKGEKRRVEIFRMSEKNKRKEPSVS
jgi:hypothetical protein